MYRVYNLTTKVLLAKLTPAQTAWQRLTGFLDRKQISEDEAMWFDRCANVHTVGMRASLDIVFLDDDHRILAVERNVGSNRLRVSYPGARSVVEFGTSPETRMTVGDILFFERAVTAG